MKNSKNRFSTFLIVTLTILLSFLVSDSVLSAIGHFIALDRISLFIVIAIALVFGLVKASSGMKISEVMLTLLLVVLFSDGVGIIGYSVLAGKYLTALFLIPLVAVSFGLMFLALHRSGKNKGKRIGKAIAGLVFAIILLALVGFGIVYFHAERLVTLPMLQSMENAEKIDFRAIISAFENGFDLNRTILTIALGVSALCALVSAVRHKGKGYGTLAFLLGLFFFDGIGICYFAFRTGDYLTGGFLVPLMIVTFGLVIGFVFHRVTGWKPNNDLLGKSMLVFALMFLVLFVAGIGFYYVQSNRAPDEILLGRNLSTVEVLEFGAAESFGKGSLVIPTVLVLVTTLFLFIGTKLSEFPFRRVDKPSRELPWQLLLSIEGFVLSFAFIAMGFSLYGVLGPVLLGLAITFVIAVMKRKSSGRKSHAFVSFFVIFLLLYAGGILHFRWNAVSPISALPAFIISIAIGTACAVLVCWALRLTNYKLKNRETVKVIAIIVALLALIALCLFGYYLRTNPPEPEKPAPIVIPIEKEPEPEPEPVVEVEPEPAPIVDVDEVPEPECEVVEIPEAPEPVIPPKSELVETAETVPAEPIPVIPPKSELVEIPVAVPTAPVVSIERSLVDLEPRVPSAPQGLMAWGWTYEDDWEDDWSEDDWSEDSWSDEDLADDDFWADFYIAGEDELALEDGLYYMDLIVNGYSYGEIEVNIVNGDPGLPSDYLAYYLEGELTEEAWNRLFYTDDYYLYVSNILANGIDAYLDSDKFAVYLNFSTSDMPVRTLSLTGGGGFFKSRPIEGALQLKPATFVMHSSYNLSLYLGSLVDIDPLNYLSADFSMNNIFRIKDFYGSFSMYLDYLAGKVHFTMGTWTAYKDFAEQQLRFTFGNINGSGSIGLSLDHGIEYGGPNAKRKSLLSEELTLEKESEVVIYNEGKQIYRRRLNPGNYNLEDFTIFTGANSIEIHVKPIDGSPEQIIKKDIIYSTGLLVPGEYNWSVSLGFGKMKVDTDNILYIPSGVIGIPWFKDQTLIYDFRDISFRATFGTGISPALSFSSSLNLKNSPIESSLLNVYGDLAFELTHSNRFGTTRYNIGLRDIFRLDKPVEIPGLTAKIGHQTNFDNKFFSSLNAGLSYSTPQYVGSDNRHIITASLGFGGRLGTVGWNLSAFTNIVTDLPESSSYTVSLATSLLSTRYFSLAASMNVSGNYSSSPEITGRISGTLKLGPVNVNASTDTEGIMMNASGSAGNHSFNINSSSPELTEKRAYGLDGSYTYNGNMFGLGFNFKMTNQFKDASLGMSISSNSVFADGLMAFGNHLPSNFLLVTQKGAIKGNDLSVASIGSSSSNVLPSMFGVSVYSGISSYANDGFTIYSSSDDSFGASSSYDVSLLYDRGMQGYVLRLEEDPSFSISGVAVNPSGDIWLNGSSPVYQVSLDETGKLTPYITEDYMFTDETGRFILSDMKPGLYGFDMDYNGKWIFVVLDVSSVESENGDVIIMTLDDKDWNYSVESPYSYAVVYTNTDKMNGEEFWKMLYPEM